MGNMQIRKAERKQSKLRIGIAAPSGAGKTYGALLMARGMVDSWEKICVIDTEHGSAELYSHLGPYNVITLTAKMGFQPLNYVEAMEAAEAAGMEVIIIDSLSHAWSGEGGLLDQLDKKKGVGSSFNLWSELTPQHNKLVNKLLSVDAHLIATMRSKQSYELEEYTDSKGNRKSRPVKMGLQPVQREGMEYEFTVFFDTDINHYTSASKDRTGIFAKKPPFEISQDTGEELRQWNESGAVDYTLVKNKIGKAMKTIAEAKLEPWPIDAATFAARVKEITKLELVEANYEEIAAILEPLAAEWKDNPNQFPDTPAPKTPPEAQNAPQTAAATQPEETIVPEPETAESVPEEPTVDASDEIGPEDIPFGN